MSESLPEDFYRPTRELTIDLIRASQKVPESEDFRLPEPVVMATREDIAQRIWGCMVGVARANTIAQDRNSCALDIDEAFPELSRTLKRRLAIPVSEAYLIEQALLPRFLSWLRGVREYKAPWGVMEYDGQTLAFSKVHVRRIFPEGFSKAASKREDEGFEKVPA
jgi:hypothetical protein